jgi:hypothetical protein
MSAPPPARGGVLVKPATVFIRAADHVDFPLLTTKLAPATWTRAPLHALQGYNRHRADGLRVYAAKCAHVAGAAGREYSAQCGDVRESRPQWKRGRALFH